MQALSSTDFAEMAVGLHDEPDMGRMLSALVAFAQLAAECEEVGVLLCRRGAPIESATATRPRVAQSHQLQLLLDEGPGLLAIRDSLPVIVDDVTDDRRWPEWAPRAAQLGWRSMMAVPLGPRHATIGVLDFYADEPGVFDLDDRSTITTLGAHAFLALAAAKGHDGLRAAAHARHLIGQAEGILMERHGLGVEQAFAIMRRESREGHVTVSRVAERIIENRHCHEY